MISKSSTPRLPKPGSAYDARQQSLFVDLIERQFDRMRAQISALIDSTNGRYVGLLVEDTIGALDDTYIDRLVETTAASVILTIPTDAQNNLGSGCVVRGIHHGTGALTFTGVTLVYPAGLTGSVPYGSQWTLIKSAVAANTWALSYTV